MIGKSSEAVKVITNGGTSGGTEPKPVLRVRYHSTPWPEETTLLPKACWKGFDKKKIALRYGE